MGSALNLSLAGPLLSGELLAPGLVDLRWGAESVLALLLRIAATSQRQLVFGAPLPVPREPCRNASSRNSSLSTVATKPTVATTR